MAHFSLPEQDLNNIQKYFRAVNYISAAQIYLKDNFLLERPLAFEHLKPRLLGHWGTCPGINFVYSHLNYYLTQHDESMMLVVGPGHGFPAIQANLFMEETLSKYYPEVPFNADGLSNMIQRFSWPYGFPSHANPGAPGAILEGGELGYSLSTAWGAVLDNPDLTVACLVGDGEAETGPLSASWMANKLVSPIDSGTVLPILHLNGYKISGPTLLARMNDEELHAYFTGLGYTVHFVEYKNNEQKAHEDMAATLAACMEEIHAIRKEARSGKKVVAPKWPMIVMRTPKGWTGIEKIHGKDVVGNYVSHQVVVTHANTDVEEKDALEAWLRSYKFEELFSKEKGFTDEVQAVMPPAKRRIGQNPHSYGEIREDLHFPPIKDYETKVIIPGSENGLAMNKVGEYLRDIFKLNKKEQNFRLFCPDETYSNKLQAVFEETKRAFQWPILAHDEDIASDGRVMEMLSEHTLQGLMQGYTLTGRYGVLCSYEAFVQIVSSMADQYAKFLKASLEFPWREPVGSFNYLLSSLGWRQDHNGYSHQNPGFVSNMLEKHGNLTSVYFPVDNNMAIAVMEECLSDIHCINVIVCDKQNHLQWLTLDEARTQVQTGIGIWHFASDANPDIVFSSAGDLITIETLAAVKILKEELPHVRVRYVNVSELTAIGVADPRSHTNQEDFDMYFTSDKPVIFNYHGYTGDIKHLLFDSTRDTSRFRVHGYEESGSTTSPFDMMVRNKTSRYHLVLDALHELFEKGTITAEQKTSITKKIEELLATHRAYILAHGDDPDYIKNWTWN